MFHQPELIKQNIINSWSESKDKNLKTTFRLAVLVPYKSITGDSGELTLDQIIIFMSFTALFCA